MSDTTDVTSDVSDVADDARPPAGAAVPAAACPAMLLPELQTMAASLGISGTARMRKGELIAAIEQNQADSRVPRARAEAADRASLDGAGAEQRSNVAARGDSPRTEVRAEVREAEAETATEQRAPRRASRAAGAAGAPEDRDGARQRPRRACVLQQRASARDRAGGERNGRGERGRAQ